MNWRGDQKREEILPFATDKINNKVEEAYGEEKGQTNSLPLNSSVK
jgi:hypothetical protein